ncbi:MAG: serine/threonine-protein phosphatase [Burkholderiales bacterium]|nr:serine/threonine-protein phosphatase [Burkholderiales bacterium]
MQLEVSVLSNPGGRERNEDACGFWTADGGCVCVVSDGAGGHGGGDVASKLAVRVILTEFQQTPAFTAAAVDAALQAAHRAIVAQQAGSGTLSAMRATATVLAVDTIHRTAAWGHVGDTRLYCFRDGRVIAQTKDHSVVQRMVDAGYLGPAALRESLQRSRLFAALGHDEAFTVTLGDASFDIVTGDAFLLCSDGFWEYVDESAMALALADARSPADWLRIMEQDVLANGRREQDNFSALAVWCREAVSTGDAPAPLAGRGTG